MKLQSFSGDESVLKVCKLNTNNAIKLYKCSRKKLLSNVHQKIFFLSMKRAGKAFTDSCPWLFIHLLFNTRIALTANMSWTTLIPQELHRFSKLGKPYMHKKATVTSHSNK